MSVTDARIINSNIQLKNIEKKDGRLRLSP